MVSDVLVLCCGYEGYLRNYYYILKNDTYTLYLPDESSAVNGITGGMPYGPSNALVTKLILSITQQPQS